jgi:hypothetical protein
MGIEDIDTNTTQDVFSELNGDDDVLVFSDVGGKGGGGPLPSEEDINKIMGRMADSGRGNFAEGTPFAYGTNLAGGRGWGLQGLILQISKCYGSLNDGLRILDLAPRRGDLVMTTGGKENVRATLARVLLRKGVSPLAVAWAASDGRPTARLGTYAGKPSWKLSFQVGEGALETGYADTTEELKERLYSGHGALVPRPKKPAAPKVAPTAEAAAPAAPVAPAAPAAPAVPPLERLKSLKMAFEAELISEEDYNTKKAEILSVF